MFNLKKKVHNFVKQWKKKREWPHGGYSDYPGVGIVYDDDIGKYAFQHLRIRDRFDYRKVAHAILMSENILFKVFTEDELPKKKNWKFGRDF